MTDKTTKIIRALVAGVKASGIDKKLIIGIVIFVMIIYYLNNRGSISSSTSSSREETSTQEGYMSPINSDPIDVSYLTAIYHQNEVAADLKFKGKRLKIIGFVDQIRKDVFDNPVVDLGVYNHPLMSTSCKFNKNDEYILAQLRKGMRITIIGTCSGMVIGSVSIDHCTIIK